MIEIFGSRARTLDILEILDQNQSQSYQQQHTLSQLKGNFTAKQDVVTVVEGLSASSIKIALAVKHLWSEKHPKEVKYR